MRGAVRRAAIAAACLLPCAVVPRPAQEARTTSESIQLILGDSAEYRHVITAFQAAVQAHDAAGVAALVRYPITVRVGGTSRTIKSPQKFVARYDSIITPAIAAAVQGQAYDSMMVNARGVMLGQGEVWFNGTCRDAKCTASTVRVIAIQSTGN